MTPWTYDEWKEMSFRGQICNLMGCRNAPLSPCPVCNLLHCYDDIKNHPHIMSDDEVRNHEEADESLR